MYFTEENTIESFLIENICEAIEQYNEEVDNVCDDDDLLLISDGLNENSIIKIKEICNRVILERAPLKMLVLWIAIYVYGNEEISIQGENTIPDFEKCILDNESWYEFEQQNEQAITSLWWDKYKGNYSDKKYVIVDFRKGIERVIKIFNEQNNVNLHICIWLVELLKSNVVEKKVYLCTDIQTSGLDDLKMNILSGIKLAILLSGKVLHGIQEYTRQPLEITNGRGAFNYLTNYNILSKPYQQYSQIYEVINEYNGTKGIIEKYLKLYQVFEELMIRVNLVKFSKDVISVRDIEEFKSLRNTERETLKKMFSKILHI